MSLIYAKMQKRINGHKGLTDHKNVIDVNDVNPVYIPLASGNSTSFDIKVEVGDKVKVGTLLAVRNDGLIVPLFSSVSGTIQAIQKHKHGLGEIDHVVIENDFNFD